MVLSGKYAVEKYVSRVCSTGVKYRRKKVSIMYWYFGKSIGRSILRDPSKNCHHEPSHAQVSRIFRLLNFEFSRFLWHLPYFPIVSSLDIWGGGIFGYSSTDKTKYRYLKKVSIHNDTKRYRYYFAPLVCRNDFLVQLWLWQLIKVFNTLTPGRTK